MDIVFFNRVPKVGSQALMELMKRLGKVNKFKNSRDDSIGHETVLLQVKLQNKLASKIISLQKSATFSKHVAYINFTRFYLPKPIYINMVRDPIERVISWHYYIRAPWYYTDLEKKLGKNAPKLPDKAFMDQDLDTCIKTRSKYCQFEQDEVLNPVGDHRRQTLFFCGQNRFNCL